MAGQNIKTYYKSQNPDAIDTSTTEGRHEARRELNRDLRERQRGQNIKTYYKSPNPEATDVTAPEDHRAARKERNRKLPKPPSLRESTGQLFSGKNIVETGKAAVRSGSAGIQNVGSRVASLTATAPHVSFAGGGLVPAWTVGAKMPKEFLTMPYARVEAPRPKHKKKKHRQEQVPVSTRPEWIRF